MEANTRDMLRGIQWLKVVIAVIALGFLSLLYIVWQPPIDNRAAQLVLQSIPSAVVVLVAVPIIYFVFRREGLPVGGDVDEKRLATAIIEGLAAPKESGTAVSGFYDTFRHVPWDELLKSAHVQVDIIVYYFESWVNANYEALREYFQRPGTRMRVFVADPTNETILEGVSRLFPEYTLEVVRGKISRTGQRLRQALVDAGGDPARLEFYYAPRLLSYSAQCLDGRTLVLSVFEMYRHDRIDSPALILDLTRSSAVSQFWHKELEGLLKESTRQRLWE